MNIVILGAGRVGESVAESLVSERNSITVIDTDPARLAELQGRLDLRGVVGNGVQPSVLREAGIEDADMLIACAPLDETNLVACKLAHEAFNVPTTVARLRSPDFDDASPLLGRSGFAVDHVLHPEQSVTARIQKLIEYPEALQVIEFAGGMVSLIAVRAVAGGPLVQHALGEMLTVVRRGGLEAVHSLRRGAAEAMEAVVRGDRKTCRIAGRRIDEAGLPRGAQVGAIVRGLHKPDGSEAGDGARPQVIIAHHDTVVETYDHVIVFVPRRRMVREVEKLFLVSATFF